VASSGRKVQVLMARQDRRAAQRAVHAKKRRTATIAPLVVLRVARSGTPPSATPLAGLTGGSPAPGLLRPGDVFHVFKHWQCLLSILPARTPVSGGRPSAPPRRPKHADRGGEAAEASMSAWRLLNAAAVSFAVSSSSLSVFNASRIDFDAAIFNSCVVGLVRGVCGVPRPKTPRYCFRRLRREGAFRRKGDSPPPQKSMNRST
jgi:hypothetical protein